MRRDKSEAVLSPLRTLAAYAVCMQMQYTSNTQISFISLYLKKHMQYFSLFPPKGGDNSLSSQISPSFPPQKEENEKGGAVLAVILFAERNKRFLTLAARVNTIDTDNTRPEISI
jgi:hypothetical protein